MLFDELVKAVCENDAAAIQEWFSTYTHGLNAKDHGGVTLLHYAVRTGYHDVMRVLLAHGATIDVDDIGATPLRYAIVNRNHTATVLLLEHGAQLDARDQAQRTPLHFAAFGGHCDMICLLLSRGADLDARDLVDRDAEATAHAWGHPEAAALLADVRLAGGWEVYVRKRIFALRVLCEQGRASTTDALLARLFPFRAPVEQDDSTGQPPLRARAAAGPPELPNEVFWLVFQFWGNAPDFRA